MRGLPAMQLSCNLPTASRTTVSQYPVVTTNDAHKPPRPSAPMAAHPAKATGAHQAIPLERGSSNPGRNRMSETSPAHAAGTEIPVGGNGAAALAAPDDHFESAAAATLSQWAALRRALERANELIDQLRAERAESTARISELVRANAQLSANLEESLAREGDA